MFSIKYDGVLESISVSISTSADENIWKTLSTEFTLCPILQICFRLEKDVLMHLARLQSFSLKGLSIHWTSRWISWQLISADLCAVGMYQICFQLPRMYTDGKEGLEGSACRLYLKASVHELLFFTCQRSHRCPHYLVWVSFV